MSLGVSGWFAACSQRLGAGRARLLLWGHTEKTSQSVFILQLKSWSCVAANMCGRFVLSMITTAGWLRGLVAGRFLWTWVGLPAFSQSLTLSYKMVDKTLRQ